MISNYYPLPNMMVTGPGNITQYVYICRRCSALIFEGAPLFGEFEDFRGREKHNKWHEEVRGGAYEVSR